MSVMVDIFIKTLYHYFCSSMTETTVHSIKNKFKIIGQEMLCFIGQNFSIVNLFFTTALIVYPKLIICSFLDSWWKFNSYDWYIYVVLKFTL